MRISRKRTKRRATDSEALAKLLHYPSAFNRPPSKISRRNRTPTITQSTKYKRRNLSLDPEGVPLASYRLDCETPKTPVLNPHEVKLRF